MISILEPWQADAVMGAEGDAPVVEYFSRLLQDRPSTPLRVNGVEPPTPSRRGSTPARR